MWLEGFYESIKYEGEKFSNRGRAFETWVKQDNKWLEIGGLESSCEYLSRCPHVWWWKKNYLENIFDQNIYHEC